MITKLPDTAYEVWSSPLPADIDKERYDKQIFMVTGYAMTVQDHNAVCTTAVKLLGRHSPSTEVESVEISFVTEPRPPQYGNKTIRIQLPFAHLPSLIHILQLSPNSYVQWFLYGENNSMAYADLHAEAMRAPYDRPKE